MCLLTLSLISSVLSRKFSASLSDSLIKSYASALSLFSLQLTSRPKYKLLLRATTSSFNLSILNLSRPRMWLSFEPIYPH